MAVKKILVDALVGVPVRVRNFALDLSRDATIEEALSALSCIRTVENHMSLRARFCQGDLFNQVTARGKARKEFIAGVKAAHGERYYNSLRRYGWVAAKWREDRRSDSKCWAFYVNNEPGRPALPKRERPPEELALVGRDGDLLTLAAPGGTQFLYRLTQHGDDNPPEKP